MSIAKVAFNGLYPGKEPNHEFKVKYSGKFNGYNANVHYNKEWMEFRLAKNWKEVNADIKIGLLQSLMLKVYSDNIKTINIDLYNIFLKKVHVVIPKINSDPILLDSFNRVNEKYFNSNIEVPNLKWGTYSKRKLGSYEYGSDTIIISRIIESELTLIDYVMYHELLHKKFKFNVKNRRSFHHTKEFREAESKFENFDQIEKKISVAIRSKINNKKKWYEFF